MVVWCKSCNALMGLRAPFHDWSTDHTALCPVCAREPASARPTPEPFCVPLPARYDRAMLNAAARHALSHETRVLLERCDRLRRETQVLLEQVRNILARSQETVRTSAASHAPWRTDATR